MRLIQTQADFQNADKTGRIIRQFELAIIVVGHCQIAKQAATEASAESTPPNAVQNSPRINGIMPSEDPVNVDFEESVSNAT
jgi:hypothetical protein